MATDNLDDLITATARQMTHADPSADLHARVLSRLDARTSPIWTWRLLPAAATLMAVAVVMTMVVRRPHLPIPAAETAASASFAPGRSIAADRDAGVERPGLVPDAADVRHSASAPSNPTSDVQAEWQARALPALSPLESLTIESIQPGALAIRPLEIQPLVTVAIEDRF